eukprot:1725025-Rhodomonas_salina.2
MHAVYGALGGTCTLFLGSRVGSRVGSRDRLCWVTDLADVVEGHIGERGALHSGGRSTYA